MKKKSDWWARPIDPRIHPLVKSLNDTGCIHTFASCQGHFLRTSDPYVAFYCAPDIAEVLAITLNRLRATGQLKYPWQINGHFDSQNKLCFDIRVERLLHGTSILMDFWNYVVWRRRIDADLHLLSKSLTEALKKRKNRFEHPVDLKKNDTCHNTCQKSHGSPNPRIPSPPNRILGPATRTSSVMVGSQVEATNPTFLQGRHPASPFGCISGFLVARREGKPKW